MIDTILEKSELFIIALYAFFVFFLFRNLLIKRKLSILGYHIILFCIFFIILLGGGGVQNADYDRLEKFIELEKNNRLNDVKQNPQNYESGLKFDVQQFKNSDDFIAYIKKHDNDLDRFEAISTGWIMVLIFDVALMCAYILRYIVNKIKNRFFIRTS